MGVTGSDVVIEAGTPMELADRMRPWRDAVDEAIVRALPGEDSVSATVAILRATRVAW
jgi:hypothetical protein